MPASDYFPTHAHSEFSVLDGMGSVHDMVARVAKLGQPGLALTDHGTMAGVIRLYKECQKFNLAAFPGSELYVVNDVNDPVGKEKRYHMGMLALNFEGYKAMVALSSRSHTRERFHRRPLVDFGDLADMADAGYTEHVAVSTGCFFGVVVQTLVHGGYNNALAMTKTLASWFPNLYVELQRHDIPAGTNELDEDEVTDALLDIADELGLPVMLGQDSHYCDSGDQDVHNLMKDICYFGDSDDFQFPGGPYHLASTKWLRDQWDPDVWDRIEEGHGDLLDKHALSLPAVDNYKFHVPSVSKDPNGDLTMKCIEALDELDQTEGLPQRSVTGIPLDYDDYAERIESEMHVISTMGMADYFLIFEDLITGAHANGVVTNTRGSANGSLVAYLTGITTIDPLYWETSFDRFLSLDRKKPPDIDVDVESGKRHILLERAKAKFPNLVPIGTYGRIGITETEDGTDKGSVYVQYAAARRRKGTYNGTVDPADRPLLEALSTMHVRRSLGVHAGGYVLETEKLRIADYLPTALVASSNTTVTQAPMEDVEDVGFLKGDFLGLRALETLNLALANIGRKPMDFKWIPWDDEKACKVLRSGKTDGIFQFEGYSTRKGGQEMGVKSTLDAILCLALYRPALMASGYKDMYLANRKKRKGSRPHQLHPFFDPILDVTLGVPVFQEQIMEIMRSVKMEYEDWNELMKAVKASNDKIGEYAIATMDRIHPIFIKLCKAQGISQTDAEDVWEAVVGFTDYGFNRSHATSYGVMAYRSAYLKAHYPLEYMHACLATWAGDQDTPKKKGKEPMYVRELRRLGFHTARPDINKSGVVWTIDSKKRGVVRKGLTSIKGIGDNVAASIVEHRPDGGWMDMDELIDSVPAKPVSGGKSWKKDGTLNGVLAKLRDAGALRSLGVEPEQ